MNRENKGIVLILISAFGYGMMPILSVNALRSGTAVSTLLFSRFALAALLLWLYIIVRKVPYKTSMKTVVYISIIGLMGFTVASVTIYTAYKYISGSIATLILFSHPIFVMIFEKILFKHKTTFRRIFAIVLTSLGLVIVLYVNESIHMKGVILSFISSIAYGGYCLGLSEKNTQKLSGVTVTAYVATVTAIAMAIQCFYVSVPLLPTTKEAIISALLLTFISTLLASITFYEGLSIVGPSSATLISSIEPMFVVLLSGLILNETIGLNTIIGGIIIVLGIIVLEYKNT